jgi:predicted amidohydrolase YtcJ
MNNNQPIADLVLINGNIITVDSIFSIARAIAIKCKHIVKVGTNEGVKSLIGKKTRLIDLKGKTVLPGINDSHMHAALFAGTRPPLVLDVGYPSVKSINDIENLVAERVKSAIPGEWIRGAGLDEGYLTKCQSDPSRHLDKKDLDRVSPVNPIYLVSISLHKLVANSMALDIAKITRDTEVASGSEIVKDTESGEPTGLFIDLPAEGLIMKVVPPWTKEQKKRAILSMMTELNSRGITSITEGGLGPGGTAFQGGLLDAECISVYNDLYSEGKLTLRVNILYLFGNYGACSLLDFKQIVPKIGIHSGFGNAWLKIGGIKVFADGIPNSKTAWMHDDFPDGGNGSLMIPGKNDTERYNELIDMIGFAHQYGFQVGIHAIGGKAIECCIDGFIKAQSTGHMNLRHYIIHGDFVSDKDIKRMARNNIGICVQPIIKCASSDVMDRLVGLKLSERQFPLRALIDSGVHTSASSDAPVVFPDWLNGIQSAVLRESKSGTVRGPKQCITVKDAIKMFTIEGAWQDHMEHVKGSIEPGKLADLCILDQDVLAVDLHNIKQIRNLATIIGGKFVYNVGID